jgi:cytochrome c-type biogenesis protein CcmH
VTDNPAAATARLQSPKGNVIAAAAVFLLVAGIGAVTSFLGNASEPGAFGDTISPLPSISQSSDEAIARLVDYARSTGIEEPAPLATTGDPLLDVNTMTDRLAARLETTPEDIQGWTLLLRSRVVLGEQEVAGAALRKALEIFKADPAALNEIRATAIELGLKAE